MNYSLYTFTLFYNIIICSNTTQDFLIIYDIFLNNTYREKIIKDHLIELTKHNLDLDNDKFTRTYKLQHIDRIENLTDEVFFKTVADKFVEYFVDILNAYSQDEIDQFNIKHDTKADKFIKLINHFKDYKSKSGPVKKMTKIFYNLCKEDTSFYNQFIAYITDQIIQFLGGNQLLLRTLSNKLYAFNVFKSSVNENLRNFTFYNQINWKTAVIISVEPESLFGTFSFENLIKLRIEKIDTRKIKNFTVKILVSYDDLIDKMFYNYWQYIKSGNQYNDDFLVIFKEFSESFNEVLSECNKVGFKYWTEFLDQYKIRCRFSFNEIMDNIVDFGIFKLENRVHRLGIMMDVMAIRERVQAQLKKQLGKYYVLGTRK